MSASRTRLTNTSKSILLVLGISIIVSCAPWVATRQVRFVGEINEFSENPQKLIISSNGSVAVEYISRRYYQTLDAVALIQPYMGRDYEFDEKNFGYLKDNYLPDRKRYILFSRESIEKEIEKYPDSYKEAILIAPKNISEKVFVHKRITSDNASIADLPSWFGAPSTVYDRSDGTLTYDKKAGILNNLDYMISGGTYKLHFHAFYERTERTPWGYLFQVLLPPAIVIDIARVTVGYVLFPFVLIPIMGGGVH